MRERDRKSLIAKALSHFERMSEAELLTHSHFRIVLYHAWELGKLLNRLKPMIGHGDWLPWLKNTFPNLHERRAQRCMLIDTLNPNATSVSGLRIESVRTLSLSYVPGKERSKH